MDTKQEVLNLYKRPGETPLECIKRFKAANPEYENAPMTYAGRLDPLAEGVLIVLAGEARFRKEEFLGLPKTYEFEVLWGFRSDTHDVLGLAEFALPAQADIELRLKLLLPNFVGEFDQAYPLYSSRTVGGVPLFALAREGKIALADAPKKKVTIARLEMLGTRKISKKAILQEALGKIESVSGDFRQEEIAASWTKALEAAPASEFIIAKLSAEVSSGTYIRSLAHELGKDAGCGAIAWRIVRTRVGNFDISDSKH